LERVCVERLEIHDLRSSGAVYGKPDCGVNFYSEPVNPTDREIAYMGSIVMVDGCADHKRITLSPSLSSSGINRPDLRKPHLFFDLLV
jgi:hypothetical protein